MTHRFHSACFTTKNYARKAGCAIVSIASAVGGAAGAASGAEFGAAAGLSRAEGLGAATDRAVIYAQGNGVTNAYVLLATACDGTLATTAQFTSTRVVCNNTLAVALGAVPVR